MDRDARQANKPLEQRREEAGKVIRDHVAMAAAAGFIPAPIIDAVAVAALEVNMIGDLARVYDFPVPTRLVITKLLISVAGSVGPVFFAHHLHGSFKSMPIIGYALSASSMSISGAISVYAVGKLFQKHYESGGTFLSSENSVVRRFFRESREEGKHVVPAYIR